MIDSKNFKLYLLFSILFIFVDTFIFIFIFGTITSFYLYKKIEFTKLDIYFLKMAPILYYVNYFYNLFRENINSSMFWDMQNFLHYIKCNVKNESYSYFFDNTLKSCPETIGYGPLIEFINLGDFNIDNLTTSISILFITICLILLLKTKEYIYLVLTVLSPGFHFLLISMNSDIFVLIYCLILCFRLKNINSIVNLTVLSVFTLVKTYTIFIFLSLLIINLVKKDSRNTAKVLIFFIINLLFIVNHYLVLNSLLPDPISFTRSFGVLHDLTIMSDYIGYGEGIFAIFIFTTFFIFNRKRFTNFYSTSFNFHTTWTAERVLILLPMCVAINLYQSWGYKFIFNSLLMYFIFNNSSLNYKIFIVFLNLFSSSYFTIGWGFEENILNIFILLLSKGLFYTFLLFIPKIFRESINSLQ